MKLHSTSARCAPVRDDVVGGRKEDERRRQKRITTLIKSTQMREIGFRSAVRREVCGGYWCMQCACSQHCIAMHLSAPLFPSPLLPATKPYEYSGYHYSRIVTSWSNSCLGVSAEVCRVGVPVRDYLYHVDV